MLFQCGKTLCLSARERKLRHEGVPAPNLLQRVHFHDGDAGGVVYAADDGGVA
jgi:hypothetical protein